MYYLSISDYFELSDNLIEFFTNIASAFIGLFGQLIQFLMKSVNFFLSIFTFLYDILFNDIFNNLPYVFRTGILSLLGVFIAVALFKALSLFMKV